MTGAGIPTSAVNHLSRLDDNAYAWQSVERYLGELALPDTGEVVIKRLQKESQPAPAKESAQPSEGGETNS
jgi:hypothetical protein